MNFCDIIDVRLRTLPEIGVPGALRLVSFLRFLAYRHNIIVEFLTEIIISLSFSSNKINYICRL